MFRRAIRELLDRILVLAVTLSLLVTMFLPTPVQAGNADINSLALQALRNNYDFYRSGQAVDGGWGNYSAYDGYILAQAGAHLSSWIYEEEDFVARLNSLIDSSINNEGSAGASSAKRITAEYLLARKLGDDGRGDALLNMLKNRQTANANGSFDNSAFSDISALEMLGRAGDIDEIDTTAAITYLLGEQDTITGAWTAAWNDLMSTAEAIRALNYLLPYAAGQSQAVSDAMEKGRDWLAARQKDDGSFQDDGGWDDPVVDTAEVIYTLKLLQIDPDSWLSLSGNSPVDYLLSGAENDGVFGSSPNIAANTWVLDAYLQLGAGIDSESVLEINVSPSTAVVNKGESKQFSATAYILAGNTKDVTSTAAWTVVNPNLAAIDAGLLTGLATGNTDLYAAYGGLSGLSHLSIEESGNSGGQTDKSIRVYLAVVGSDGELLFSPRTVSVYPEDTYGLTAVGALDATGLSWDSTPGLVTEIEGQQNHGMNGWMYKINNKALKISAFESSVKENDKVIWWYSYDPNSEGPSWKEVSNGNTPGSTGNSQLQSSQDMGQYSQQLDELKDSISIINADKRMSSQQIKELQKELGSNQVFLDKEAKTGQDTEIMDGAREIGVLIPKGAVSEPINITVQEISEEQPLQQYGIRFAGSVYQFGPDGSSFDQPLTISIRTAITDDLDIQSLSPAWYDTQKKEWIPIPALIDMETGLVVFKIDHFTDFAVLEFPARSRFDDLGRDWEWAREAIEVLAGQGIISGTGRGFEPARPISRAEFVQLLVKALNLTLPSDAVEKELNDIQAGDWYFQAVRTACANNIVSGYPDGSFKPQKAITRNEMACVLYRLQGGGAIAGELDYCDKDSIPAWAQPSIYFTAQIQLMKGYEDGSFRGHSPLTRAEAALIVYRYLNYLLSI